MTQRPIQPVAPRPPARRRGEGWILALLFWLVLGAVGAVLFVARAKHPGPEAGEFWSDSNIINATRGWDEIGFTTTWGIPRLARAAPLDDTAFLYLTYPPGPYWICYAAMIAGRAVGLEEVLAARLFAQLCGLASAALLFLVYRRLSGSTAIAGLAGLFYILSPAFLSYSAALHHMAFSPMLLFAAMVCWLRFEDGQRPRRVVWLGLTALSFAADCFVNFEHMFFFALFVGVRTAINTSWLTVLGAGVIGPIPIPVMALRVWHNAQVLGGWDASLKMFTASAERRSASSRFGVDLGELAAVWAGRLGWPWIDRPTIDNAWNTEYPFPAIDPWVLVAIGVVLVSVLVHRLTGRGGGGGTPGPVRGPGIWLVDPTRTILPLHPQDVPPSPPRILFWRRPRPGPVASGLLGGLLLLACGLTWFVVMTQHTRPHRFIVLLLMPGLSLLLGTIAWWAVASARRATVDRVGLVAWWVRGRAWLVSLAMLAVFAANIRRADVLNQLAPLDERAHARIVDRMRGNADAEAAGQRLGEQGVTRVQMFDGANMMPWRAAAIRLPYIYIRREMVETIEPTDAVCIEAWDQAEIRGALDAAERFGLPDLVRPPGDRTLVFRGSRGEGDGDVALDLALGGATPGAGGSDPGEAEGGPDEAGLGGGLVVRSARWDRTLLGHEGALSLLVTSNVGWSDLSNRFVFILTIRGDNGRVLHESRTRVRWSPLRDAGRALVLLSAPAEAMAAGAVAELVIWDRQTRGPVPLPEVTGSGSAQGVEVGDDGQRLRWTVRRS